MKSAKKYFGFTEDTGMTKLCLQSSGGLYGDKVTWKVVRNKELMVASKETFNLRSEE